MIDLNEIKKCTNDRFFKEEEIYIILEKFKVLTLKRMKKVV